MPFVHSDSHGVLLHSYPPRACWRTSLAHTMTRKGRLFWSQRKRQRSSDKEPLGSPESRSESGGSSSAPGCGPRWCPCGWEWEWLWEVTLDLLEDAHPLDSPGLLVMVTRTSLLSGSLAAGVGVLGSCGCRVGDKPFPVWAPRSLASGCITAEESLSFSALLVSLLWQKKTRL